MAIFNAMRIAYSFSSRHLGLGDLEQVRAGASQKSYRGRPGVGAMSKDE